MAKDEKPNGARAGWKLLASNTRFENNILRLRQDEIEAPGGKKTDYAYMERDDAVIVVPVTEEGEIILLNQYRYPVDEWCLEVPAGGTHDSGEAALEEVARKELREEVGGTARSLTYVTFFFSAPAISDEKCHVFLAEGVELEKKPKTESTESIEIKRMPIAKALELARSGAMKTAPCAFALLLCESFLGRAQQRHTPDELLET